jgi:hypothetical protein
VPRLYFYAFVEVLNCVVVAFLLGQDLGPQDQRVVVLRVEADGFGELNRAALTTMMASSTLPSFLYELARKR